MLEEIKILEDKIETILFYFGSLDKDRIIKIVASPSPEGPHKNIQFIQDQIELQRKQKKGSTVLMCRVALTVAISRKLTKISQINKIADEIISLADKFKPLEITFNSDTNIKGLTGKIEVEKRIITPIEAGQFIGSRDALVDLLYKYGWMKTLKSAGVTLINEPKRKPTKGYSTNNAIALYLTYAHSSLEIERFPDRLTKKGIDDFCEKNKKELRISNTTTTRAKICQYYGRFQKIKKTWLKPGLRVSILDAIDLLKEQNHTSAIEIAQNDLLTIDLS